MWIADFSGNKEGTKGHQVHKFSPKGDKLMSLGLAGKPGNADGQFNQPNAVVVGPDGSIYVADGHDAQGMTTANAVSSACPAAAMDVPSQLAGMPSIAGRRGRRSDRLCQTVIFLGFAAVNRAAIDRILARNRSIRRVAEPGVITDHAPSRPGPRAFVEGLIQMPRSSPTRCGRSGARSSSTTWCGGSMPGPIDRRGKGDVARGSPGPPRGAVGHKSGREIWRESEPARLTFAIGYHLFPDRHRTSQI